MTDHGWNDVHALSGAYAVDALDDEERARFEEHLRRCPDCRAEVAGLREAAASLPVEPAAPSPQLRDRILEGIETIRPLPPLTQTTADVVPLTRRRLRPAATSLLVAAVTVLIAAVGGAFWLHPWSSDKARAPETAADRVLDADDAARVTEKLGDAQATVVVSRSEGRAVIVTKDMPLAPEGRTYELWFQTPQGTMQPAGLMPDDRDATVLLDGDASDATGVGITVEPDGGSPQPTSDPIAFFKLTT
jgi:anti-sigma-K factor RskA